MTTTTKATLNSLVALMAEHDAIEKTQANRPRCLQLGGVIVKTAKALWDAANSEAASLSQEDITAIESAYDKATNGRY